MTTLLPVMKEDASEARKTQGAIEIIDGAEAVLGGEGLPDCLLGVQGVDLVESGIHVAGGDAVNPDVV